MSMAKFWSWMAAGWDASFLKLPKEKKFSQKKAAPHHREAAFLICRFF
jgi:hypothetical protein